MIPIFLFGLVGIVGVAAIFRVLGDETDYAGDDLDEEDDLADPSGAAEETDGPAPTDAYGQDDPKDP